MQKQRLLLVTATAASLALGAMTLAQMTAAQGPGGQSGERAPGSASAGKPGSSVSGPGGRMPVMTGTVTETDAGTGSISFTSPVGGDQSMRVTANTRYSTQTTSTVADLKVNDQIQVQGVPTGITASSILAGNISDFTGAGPSGPGGNSRPAGPGGLNTANGGPALGQQPHPQSSAFATGTITSLSPLTIAIGNDITIVLRLAPNARVNKITPTTFLKLKAGDRLIATGQAASDGTFTAVNVGVNLDIEGIGPGAPAPVGVAGRTKPGGSAKPGGNTGDAEANTDADPGTAPSAAAALPLLQANCRCHSGGGRAPDLSHEGSQRTAAWLAAYIANPQSKNPSSRMPAMAGKVSSKDIATMANYLASHK